VKKEPPLHVKTNPDGIARSQVMDVDVYKIYKYQPKIEKQHALT